MSDKWSITSTSMKLKKTFFFFEKPSITIKIKNLGVVCGKP